MKQHKRRFYLLGTTIAAFLLIAGLAAVWQQERLGSAIAAIFQQEEKSEIDELKSESVALKVVDVDERTFLSNYGTAYLIHHPQADVAVVPMPQSNTVSDYEQKMEELLKEENPDVINLSPALYAKWAMEGKLLALDTKIKEEKYDLDVFYPTVIESLRQWGSGQLYGLSPDFRTSVIYYNKELFDRFGVDYPTDQMSWDEVMGLAARFPVEPQDGERYYGFDYSGSYNGTFGLIRQIGTTDGLQLVDPQDGTFTTQTPGWQSIWELVVGGVQQGWIKAPGERQAGSKSFKETLQANTFINGHAAMIIGTHYQMGQLDLAVSQYKLPAIDWDIVTQPVSEQNHQTATDFSLSSIYAVNANSANPEAAWELVKQINSADNAAKLARLTFGSPLSTRIDIPKKEIPHHYEAFYKLEADPDELQQTSDAVVDWSSILTVAEQQIKLAIAGSATIEEAVAQLQSAGQAAVRKPAAESGAKQ